MAEHRSDPSYYEAEIFHRIAQQTATTLYLRGGMSRVDALITAFYDVEMGANVDLSACYEAEQENLGRYERWEPTKRA